MSYFEEGLQLFRETQFDKASELFIKALEEDGDNSEIYNYLGLSKQALGFFEEAINYYGKGIEIDENYAELYYNRANCEC
ncbi:TPR domain-containing protein [Brachyspira hampsonii 30599]|nr:TPR domain-containing protein [Brachyspira hampsonii 30599]